jgi:hypothetical protein
VNYSGEASQIPEAGKFSVDLPGAPDCPVNYSGEASQIPEASKFSVDLPGAPDTVRWHIGQSDAPD